MNIHLPFDLWLFNLLQGHSEARGQSAQLRRSYSSRQDLPFAEKSASGHPQVVQCTQGPSGEWTQDQHFYSRTEHLAALPASPLTPNQPSLRTAEWVVSSKSKPMNWFNKPPAPSTCCALRSHQWADSLFPLGSSCISRGRHTGNKDISERYELWGQKMQGWQWRDTACVFRVGGCSTEP